jgi:SAM-dependent methyltransferase
VGFRSSIWNAMYHGEPTWELGGPDPELLAALESHHDADPGRALDLGCGTGDNAIELARRGFEVTAIDIADRALARAEAKARSAGVAVDFQLGDVTALPELGGPFSLLVDRGLLMSIFGERARRSYAAALTRLAAERASVYQHQWELPEMPRAPSRSWLVTRARGFVLAPDELADRLGSDFEIEVLRRTVEPTDDPGIRRLGIRRVAKTSYWLSRRPSS